MKTLSNLAINMKALRLSRGYTLRQLASRINISFSSIQQWENGLKYPRLEHLQAFCEFFGATIEDLWK